MFTVRLVGSSNPREGRLEVFYNRQWGTVCDDGFNLAAARVACKSLGFRCVRNLEKCIDDNYTSFLIQKRPVMDTGNSNSVGPSVSHIPVLIQNKHINLSMKFHIHLEDETWRNGFLWDISTHAEMQLLASKRPTMPIRRQPARVKQSESALKWSTQRPDSVCIAAQRTQLL